jgi:Radical SAM superfamily/4Fe-4S single cluster domain/Iron-sulfur cluster-binding domain
MNLPHDKFCVLPWISLEASPIGTVRPCCLADDEIVDNNGNKFKLLTSAFADIQSSDHMQTLRQEFLAGKQPKTCRRCWAEEDAGRTSKRMHTLNRLKHMGITPEWTADAKPLMFLDLKLGNICNLKCRICGSWSSSQFATEELKFVQDNKKQSFHYQMLKDGAWPRENSQFWTELEQSLNDIRYLEFTGGEPFLIQEHFDLLQTLVDRGVAHQVEIHYNTNGTQYPEHAEEIWQHFKHVEIAFSIDDVGARFEYQRTNAIWKEVVDNIEKFKLMRARNTNITLQVCCTINVFNVYYLVDVVNWIHQQDFDFVYWNMLHDAPWASIAHLPNKAKTHIAEHLKNSLFPEKYLTDIQKIVEFMHIGTSSDGMELLKNIQQMDTRRNESLIAVAPELAEILIHD